MKPVVLLDLWLTILTLWVEKKLLLSLLSIKSLPGSKRGSSDQQMTLELLNEAFLAQSVVVFNPALIKYLSNFVGISMETDIRPVIWLAKFLKWKELHDA